MIFGLPLRELLLTRALVPRIKIELTSLTSFGSSVIVKAESTRFTLA